MPWCPRVSQKLSDSGRGCPSRIWPLTTRSSHTRHDPSFAPVRLHVSHVAPHSPVSRCHLSIVLFFCLARTRSLFNTLKLVFSSHSSLRKVSCCISPPLALGTLICVGARWCPTLLLSLFLLLFRLCMFTLSVMIVQMNAIPLPEPKA
jgi:hypothetical protein